MLLHSAWESNERGNNYRPTNEHEAISGNRTCHFTQTNSPFKTAAFSLGQLLDPGKVENLGFSVELSWHCDKIWQSLTTSWLRHTKTLIDEGWAEQSDWGDSNFRMNCWPWQGKRKEKKKRPLPAYFFIRSQ